MTWPTSTRCKLCLNADLGYFWAFSAHHILRSWDPQVLAETVWEDGCLHFIDLCNDLFRIDNDVGLYVLKSDGFVLPSHQRWFPVIITLKETRTSYSAITPFLRHVWHSCDRSSDRRSLSPYFLSMWEHGSLLPIILPAFWISSLFVRVSFVHPLCVDIAHLVKCCRVSQWLKFAVTLKDSNLLSTGSCTRSNLVGQCHWFCCFGVTGSASVTRRHCKGDKHVHARKTWNRFARSEKTRNRHLNFPDIVGNLFWMRWGRSVTWLLTTTRQNGS